MSERSLRLTVKKTWENITGENSSHVIIGKVSPVDDTFSVLPPNGDPTFKGNLNSCQSIVDFWEYTKKVNVYTYDPKVLHAIIAKTGECKIVLEGKRYVEVIVHEK